MRLASFDGGRLGILVAEDRVRDVTDWALKQSPRRTEDPLVALIEAVGAGATPQGPERPRAGTRLGPPIRQPSKIIAAAANYLQHTQ